MKKNILFITSRFPYQPLRGDQVRAYYPIKMLSRKYCIDLISFTEENVNEGSYIEMQKYCRNIEIIKISKLNFIALQIIGIITLMPSQVLCYQSFRMKKKIKEYVSKNQYSLVYFVCGRLANDAKTINNTPKGIDWIDSLSLSTKRLHLTEKSLIKKILLYFEWKKMRRFEKKQISNFDFSTITSSVDKDYIGYDSTAVIANGVDMSLFSPLDLIKEIDIIFTGNMGYLPNISAVEFFCDKIFPQIIAKRPETTFYIAGIRPSKEVQKYHNGKNIIVTGFVEDMNAILNRSTVFVAPLLSGAGIQNKILEAMACSLPVISTTYGNAGIKGTDGHNILIHNDPEKFAGAVLDLLNNKSRRKEIGTHGAEFVRQQFSWESKLLLLDEIFCSVINNNL